MASSVDNELAKHMECGICWERFEEPKMLTCQHSYCKRCLERLVTEVGRQDHEIKCPECRKETKVPSGDVNSLPSNFLINNLLSIRGNDQSNASPPCDIFPAVKKEILDIVKKSRANIRALESSIETIKWQEDDMNKNSMEVHREIDSFIDNQIELLERKRQSMKDELRNSVSAQKKILDAQMKSFQTSLGCLKSSVEFTKKALTRGSEVEIQQLTDLNSATSDLKPRGRISYSLETDLPLINLAALEKAAKIRENDEEYKLLRKLEELGMCIRLTEDLRSFSMLLETFCIRPKSKSSTLNQASKVQVTIIAPDSEKVEVPVTNDQDGYFNFSYKPDKSGDYKIEVLINGRFVHGSPFAWKVVKKSFF